MFLEVRIWPRESLIPARIKEAARSLSVPIDIVQREIILYDSLAAILRFTPVKVILKGGTLISRAFSRIPRFSWDIELATPARGKGNFDLQVLRKRFRDEGLYSRTRLDDTELVLGFFEKDEEKDVFTDILSLRRPMTTYTVGAPLNLFLRSRKFMQPNLHAALVRLKKRLNGLPMVDYVRATVSLDDAMEGGIRTVKVPSILARNFPPLRTISCNAS